MCVHSSWGNMLANRNPDNTPWGHRDLLSFSPALTSLALGGFEERQAEEETSAITVLD